MPIKKKPKRETTEGRKYNKIKPAKKPNLESPREFILTQIVIICYYV